MSHTMAFQGGGFWVVGRFWVEQELSGTLAGAGSRAASRLSDCRHQHSKGASACLPRVAVAVAGAVLVAGPAHARPAEPKSRH